MRRRKNFKECLKNSFVFVDPKEGKLVIYPLLNSYVCCICQFLSDSAAKIVVRAELAAREMVEDS